MNTQTAQIQVTRELVPEDQRLAITERLFGIHFPLKLESHEAHGLACPAPATGASAPPGF